MWAPDGDEAFDDGSYVLQFDMGETVRLIGFKCGSDGTPIPETLADCHLPEVLYYDTLSLWHSSFLREWREKALPHSSSRQ